MSNVIGFKGMEKMGYECTKSRARASTGYFRYAWSYLRVNWSLFKQSDAVVSSYLWLI